MTLINSLLSHATPGYWVELTSSLEHLNTSRAVIRLMSSHTIEDLTNGILDYQGNLVRVLYFKKTRRVMIPSAGAEDSYGASSAAPGEDMVGDTEQEAMLEYIWSAGKLEVDVNVEGGPASVARGKGNVRDVVKWRKLGFESEDMRREFDHTGMLGLECLVRRLGAEWLDCDRLTVWACWFAETFRAGRSAALCAACARAE